MIAAWDPYMEVQPPSAIGITLVEAFALFMQDRWGFERHELYEIFVSDDTDSDENRFARGAITSCAAIVLAAFIDGSIATFARPLPAGNAIKLAPSVWEIDDPLPRFATGCFNLEHWFDHTAPLTHRIFVDEKDMKAYLESMMSEDEIWEALTTDPKKSNEVAAISPAPVLEQHSESEQPSQTFNSPELRIIRRVEVIKRTGLSKSTIDNLVSERKFPAKIELGTRAVGWLRHEVDAWIEERAAKRL